MSEIDLDSHIDSATQALLTRQYADGHFLFELEADATIPAEYVLLRHYLGEPVDAALEAGIAAYLRRIQGAHGGWPLFADGAFDMSATVKAYFALKMIGDSPQVEHMRRAREAVRLRGGAERSNVFTRCLLALYGIVPWSAVPVMPVEIMLLPKWFPFHLDKISYWSRTVIVPLLVLMAKKPRARNPKGVSVAELFLEPPRQLGPTPKAPQQKASWFWFFRVVDDVLRAIEPWFPQAMRQRAIGVACEQRQELEFFRRESNLLGSALHAAAIVIDGKCSGLHLSADGFFGGLTNQHQRAVPGVFAVRHDRGCADERSHVQIMSAGVHDRHIVAGIVFGVNFACIRQAGFFFYRQRVELGAQHYCWACAVFQNGHKSRSADVFGHVIA